MKRILFGFCIVLVIISSCANTTDKEGVKKEKIQENKYSKLRTLVFSVQPEQLKLNLSKDSTIVYGVIMDWPLDTTIVTLVSFITGDASIYINSGQMMIGGYAHESITSAAKDFIKTSQALFNDSLALSNKLPSASDSTKFHLLTNKGIFEITEATNKLQLNNSVLGDLFNKGQIIIAEYRKIVK